MSSDLRYSSAINLLDTTTDSVIVINAKGIIRCVNPAVQNMFGYVPEELINRNINVLLPKSLGTHHQMYIDRYLKTGEARILGNVREMECIDKEGVSFYVALRVTEHVIDGDIYFQGILRDITEHKNRETQLEKKNRELTQSNALLERFAYISAHDLKTPLRSLSGLVNDFVHFMNIWLNGGSPPDMNRVTRCAKLISKSTESMSNTIDDTLRYCQAGSNLQLQWHSLKPIIQEAIQKSKALIKENTVNIDISKAKTRLHCDRAQMVQVFYNLITNAIQYNDKECKEIVIEAYSQGLEVLIHVQDNGIGIPEDQQHKVFELFQRLNNTGSGVGGAIVDRIIKGHGGTITIDSTVGKGSTFNIKLPIKDT